MKILRKNTILILFLKCTICFAQGEANNWYFGAFGGLSFNGGSPVPLTDGQLNTIEGCATMSNAAGQLLFYTDGIKVWNKNHQIMLNGLNLKGNPSSTQSAVVVPKPGSTSLYYIFTIAATANSDGMQYSEVDITLDNGLGGITNNKNIALFTPTCEKLTAVKNVGCNSYWVLTHGFNSNSFVAYKVDGSGVNTTAVISNEGTVITNSVFNTQGYLKFSPDGTKVVCVNTYNNVELFDFNAFTGIISNPIRITNKSCYGAEFSSSGNFLYLSGTQQGLEPNTIFQYDLTVVGNISNTEYIVSKIDNVNYGALQLASDGKIYGTNIKLTGTTVTDNTKLSVINNPENLGTNCNFSYSTIPIGGKCFIGLPQSIQSFYNNYAITNSPICFNDNILFTINGCPDVLSVIWNYGDGTTANTNIGQHTYLTTGNYTVSATYTTINGTFVSYKNISINAKPIAFPINDFNVCRSPGITFDLTTLNSNILGTQSQSVYGVSYYRTNSNALNNINPIQKLTLFNGSLFVFAKVFNLNNPYCKSNIIRFRISAFEMPMLNQQIKYNICHPFPYSFIESFVLSTKNSEIVQNTNLNAFNISFHSSQNNADLNITQLPNNYINTLPTETVYVRVENKLNALCYATTSLILKVIPEPTLPTISDFIKCRDEISGTVNFDLSAKITEILNTQTTSNYNVIYFSNLINAQNNINSILNIDNSTNPQIVFFRIAHTDAPQCFKIGSFVLSIKQNPQFNINQSYSLCSSSDLININLPTSFTSYLWSTGSTSPSIVINQIGNYSVTVFQNHGSSICSTTKTFTVVLSSKPEIKDIEITDWLDNQNSLSVNVIGIGDYEYSIDGRNYQDSQVFEDLLPDEYTIYVRDKKGCGISNQKAYILSYPKYFTPNSDGYHDYWKINFSEIEPNLTVKIFDRYGKLITVIKSDSNGWDGQINNNLLPSDDYWFVVQRESGIIHKGHFALKR